MIFPHSTLSALGKVRFGSPEAATKAHETRKRRGTDKWFPSTIDGWLDARYNKYREELSVYLMPATTLTKAQFLASIAVFTWYENDYAMRHGDLDENWVGLSEDIMSKAIHAPIEKFWYMTYHEVGLVAWKKYKLRNRNGEKRYAMRFRKSGSLLRALSHYGEPLIFDLVKRVCVEHPIAIVSDWENSCMLKKVEIEEEEEGEESVELGTVQKLVASTEGQTTETRTC